MKKISIIVPAYNEAEYLPILLESIQKQTFSNWEVIVADANSTDKTVAIAKKFKARVVQGGLPGRGRNAGAQAASGDYLLFLDADTKLPEQFLASAISQFKKNRFDIAIPYFYPLSNLRIDQTFFKFKRSLMSMTRESYPFTIGAAILITKKLHKKIGGFNESMNLGEDNDYGQRARKLGKLGIIDSTYVLLSMRRLNKEGRLELFSKYIRHGFSLKLKSLGIVINIPYDWGNFSKEKSLSGVEQKIETLLEFFEKSKPNFYENLFKSKNKGVNFISKK